jgi:iron(III) transport system substrate-binding protein
MRTSLKAASGLVALAVVLTACAGGGTGTPSGGPTSGNPAADAEILGGTEAAAELDRLYKAAVAAGQTTVTVYGPGENDKQAVYDKVFSARFPDISVTGVYVVGPDYAAKLEAEFASGQHVADMVQAGDASIAPGLSLDYFEPFAPVTARDVDRALYADNDHTVLAASQVAFGHLYNPAKLSAGEVPSGWNDLLNPALAGRIATDDVTRAGSGFATLSHLLWDGRYDAEYVKKLAGQRIAFQASSPAAGNAVATGEFALHGWYPMSFYMRDKAAGAPVEFVFPTEGGVHSSPHYIGLIKGAKNPDAAKLLATWLFTPEAQQAMAKIGYHAVVPGQPGVPGFPAMDGLDLLKPFNLSDLVAINDASRKTIHAAFAK